MILTLDIDGELLEQAEQVAALKGQTVPQLFEQALRDLLIREQPTQHPSRVKLPTFKGQGLQPGVDLDNSAALRDL